MISDKSGRGLSIESTGVLEKLIVAVQKFSEFYVTRQFTTLLTKASNQTLF